MSAEDVPPAVDDAIEAAVERYKYDPDGWTDYAWDWDHGPLQGLEGPREWQRDINTTVRDHLRNPETRFKVLQIAVASGHGIGKAHPKDLTIHTPDGLRRWGDLKPGDCVFGRDGMPTEVRAVHDRGELPIYRVTFDDGSSTLACGDHLWTVRGRNQRRTDGKWITLSTRDIIKRGVTRRNGRASARQWELPTHGAVEFPRKVLPINPYTLGVWLGDGCRNSGRITSADDDVIKWLRYGDEDVSAHVGLAWGIRGLHAKLRDLGIADRYSYQKSVPPQYLETPSSYRLELLRGLLDTDGECNAGGSIIFNSTSRALVDDVVWLVRSLGGKARVQPTVKAPFYRAADGTRIDGRPCWRATISMPDGVDAFHVGRKQARVRAQESRYLSRWIADIAPTGVADCMCITVDATDSLYLANDFIVTHNSAEMGMLSNWAMSCFPDCRIVCTANTDAQLQTKTVPEVSKWFRTAINAHWFDVKSTSIRARDPEHRENWRMDFTPWSEHNTEAFAGLHNKDKIIVLLFDEASRISDKVWEVAEGALTDENTIIIWVVFGNPTRATGRFRECFRKYRHRWVTRQIDSRTVPGTNKDKIAEWVADHGEDSDFLKVRVRGVFPSQSAMQFISEADADNARRAYGQLREPMFSFAPVILGVDPAWTGNDSLEIYLRQGLFSKHLRTIPRNDDDVAMANLIASLEMEYQADAVFVDAGYGTGIVSVGRALGKTWQLVWFGSTKVMDAGYLNKRAEMAGLVKKWLKEGGGIDPKDDILYQDMTGIETVPRIDGKIQLESKEDMKERGLPSPNRFDALGLTFAAPVSKKPRNVLPGRGRVLHQTDWNMQDAFKG